MRPRDLTSILLLVLPTSFGLRPAEAQQAIPRLVETTVIGARAEEGPDLFAQIQNVALSPQGEVFVLDSAQPRIRVFDSQGRFLFQTGRDGEGPGETRLPIACAVDDDGSFRILDMPLNRISSFAADGSLIGTRPIAGNRMLALSGADFDPVNGTFFLVQFDFRTSATVISSLNSSGGELRECLKVEDWPLQPNGSPALFSPIAAGPGGLLAVGDGQSAYEIRIYAPDGHLLRTLTREVARTVKTAAEIALEEGAAARGAALARRESGGRSTPPRPITDPNKRFFYGYALGFDETGRLWVNTGRGDETRTVFDLFDQEGVFLGEVTTARLLKQFDLRGDRMVGAGFTEDGIPVVVLLQIQPHQA